MNDAAVKEDREIVFVYGTLLRDGRNFAKYLGNAEFRGKAVTANFWYLMSAFDSNSNPGNITPGISKIKDEPLFAIAGEAFKVTKEEMAELDKLEKKGEVYDRITGKIRITREDGTEETVEAQIYVQTGERTPIQNHGHVINTDYTTRIQSWCGNGIELNA